MPVTLEGLEGEKLYWLNSVDRLRSNRASREKWLRSRAAFIEAMVVRASGTFNSVLQVGSGPHDVIDVAEWKKKCAIDPLASFYIEKFAELQDPRVDYREGCGEALPWEDSSFDLVIIRNVIDHVQDPFMVFQESKRVLVDGGHLYIWVHVLARRAVVLRRIIDLLTHRFRDSPHPYAFSSQSLRKALQRCGLGVLLQGQEDEAPRPKTPKNVLRATLGFQQNGGFVLARKGGV